MRNYQIKASSRVFMTSEQGHKMTRQSNNVFSDGLAEGDVIEINPDVLKQTLLGIGTSFTEASAFVLAHLDKEKRTQVLDDLFSEQGANFALTRTHIGACDFCVEGKYSYADIVGDLALENFSIQCDEDGFDAQQYTGIKDEQFDLLPLIQQVQAIKSAQSDDELKIMASAWTAPAWMKDIEDWYQPGTPENGFQGTGGVLKPEYEAVYADYLIKYLDSYREKGVDIWSLTPVNEPLGNNGQWESMHFSAESQGHFIKNYLGPKLHEQGYADVALFMLDHARDQLEQWADTIYADPAAAQYVDGAAVHWYESSFKVYEDIFERVHEKYPDYTIVHTEGCIDDLGKEAPDGILDPVRYKESDWFGNDAFWWNDHATDWAYTATWPGVVADDHPIYTPVHRYARNILVSLNHWVSGWIDWNMVLDQQGGPNHVGNYCGAPIMIDTQQSHVYYTPIYFILAQLSRTIRPGDRVVQLDKRFDKPSGVEGDESIYALASLSQTGLLSIQLLNTAKCEQRFCIQIGQQFSSINMPANCLQTIQVQL